MPGEPIRCGAGSGPSRTWDRLLSICRWSRESCSRIAALRAAGSSLVQMSGSSSQPSAARNSLLVHFAQLSDPRQSTKVMYPLQEIVLLMVSTTANEAASPGVFAPLSAVPGRNSEP